MTKPGDGAPTVGALDAITEAELRAGGTTKWARPDGAIGAFIAEMDFGTAPAVTAALHDFVDAGRFAYPPKDLAAELSRATAQMLARDHHWHLDPARIRPLPDVLAGFVAAIRHFSAPGSKIIVPTPSYMPFLTVPATEGREVIEVPMRAGPDGFADDLAAIAAAFDAGGGLLVLCNPHNPTGRVFTRTELTALAELVEAKGGRVFADEIWAPLVFPGHTHLPYAALSKVTAAHTVTAVAASKGFNLPGLKCAQLVLSNDADAALWRTVGFLSEHGAANPGMVATVAAYDHGGPWLAQILAYLERNRAAVADFLTARLPQVGFHLPEATYVAWLDLSAYALPGGPAAFLADRAGVACTPGTDCGAAGAGHVRLIFAMPRPILLRALERIAAALEGHTG